MASRRLEALFRLVFRRYAERSWRRVAQVIASGAVFPPPPSPASLVRVCFPLVEARGDALLNVCPVVAAYHRRNRSAPSGTSVRRSYRSVVPSVGAGDPSTPSPFKSVKVLFQCQCLGI